MKYIKLILIFLFLNIGVCSFAQPEQTRGAKNAFEHDFGIVSGERSSYTFEYKNNSPSSVLQVKNVMLPEGISVTIVTKKVLPHSSIELVVEANPELMMSGKFKKEIVVEAIRIETGMKTSMVITFVVEGEIK